MTRLMVASTTLSSVFASFQLLSAPFTLVGTCHARRNEAYLPEANTHIYHGLLRKPHFHHALAWIERK